MVGMLGCLSGPSRVAIMSQECHVCSCPCHVCFPPSERSLPSSADAAHPNHGEWAQACKPHPGKVDRYPGRRFLPAGVGDPLRDGSEVKNITALKEDLSSFSRTHKWAHSSSSKKSDGLFCMPEALPAYNARMHMRQKHSDT